MSLFLIVEVKVIQAGLNRFLLLYSWAVTVLLFKQPFTQSMIFIAGYYYHFSLYTIAHCNRAGAVEVLEFVISCFKRVMLGEMGWCMLLSLWQWCVGWC